MTIPTDLAKLCRWGIQTKITIPARFAQAFKMDRPGVVVFYANAAGELCIRHANQEDLRHATKKHSLATDRPAEQPAPPVIR